jgi:hypothetical protein
MRGIIGFIFCTSIAKFRKERYLPLNWKTQYIRLFSATFGKSSQIDPLIPV